MITNSRIVGNKAAARGGGVLNIGRSASTRADLTISFSTITDNDASLGSAAADEPGFGGGIYNSEQLLLSNSIVAGNRDQRSRSAPQYSPDCFNGTLAGVPGGDAVLSSLGGNILGVGNDRCPHTVAATDQAGSPDSPLDPRFGSWDEGGLHADSPAIDRAVDVGAVDYLRCPARDQGGLLRPADGDGDGSARCDSGANERAAHARRDALFVVGDTNLSTSDDTLAEHLGARNYSVSVRDDAADLSDAADYYDVVVVSESVQSALLPESLASAPVPIVCLEPGFLDELQLTTLAWDETQGAEFGETRLRVAANPVTAPLTGLVTVTTAPAKFAWGVPASADAIRIAELDSQPGNWAMFAYPAGATLVDGTAAPAPRVATFVADGTPELLNAAGWSLFDAALDWL